MMNLKRLGILIVALMMCVSTVCGQFRINEQTKLPEWLLQDKVLLTVPQEGLWSVSTAWQDNWMADWHHANPTHVERSADWQVLSGELTLPQGTLQLRDAYRQVRPGLIQCRRRLEWRGADTLYQVNLSVRLRLTGRQMQVFMPGILYYGNQNGAQVNPQAIPTYMGKSGEFAIFEDHRFPMPFAMLESAEGGYAAAVHTVPSPVRGASLADQWWSLGVEAADGYTDFVLYTGPIGYNGQHGVAKALQTSSMAYGPTYLDMEPGRIIEKEFYVELYDIEREGTGFQRPVYTALDLYKPYFAESFPEYKTIIQDKYRFACSRWMESAQGVAGFDMYDPSQRQAIVMGWCGQADSPGYALQVLEAKLNDPSIHDRVQRSLDFLSTAPVDTQTGMFPVRYSDGTFSGEGDPVSCGQAMYNFAKAVAYARKTKSYDTSHWEMFLRKCCEGQSRRILRKDWNPRSTAEAFCIAPLMMASVLFDEPTYATAARKSAQLYANRHLAMNGCYWGGTLDATCEDKEGAWAAFQGFLTLYDQTHEEQYLHWAKHAMDVCLSYVVVWDIPLPAGRMSDFRFRSTGWTVVSPQNQHIDVYGVLFAPEIYRMGTYLQDVRLQQLSRVMFRSCAQLIDIYGSQGEQLQQTNFAQRGDMQHVHRLRGGYAERWTVFWITAHFLNAAAKFEEMGVEP
jgi:hypothetical protein